MDKETALKKMLHYCDYQDRCKKEIFTKLNTLELTDDDRDFVVEFLKDEGFINDERYCRSFVKGKLNLKKWGVNKIKLSLIAKGVDDDGFAFSVEVYGIFEELLPMADERSVVQEIDVGIVISK